MTIKIGSRDVAALYLGERQTSVQWLGNSEVGKPWEPSRLGEKLIVGWDVTVSDSLILDTDHVSEWRDIKKNLTMVGAGVTRPTLSADGYVMTDGSQYLTLTLSPGDLPKGSEECEVHMLCIQSRPGSVASLDSFFAWGNTGVTGQSRLCGRINGSGAANFLRTRGSTGSANIDVTGSQFFDGVTITRHVYTTETIRHEIDGIADGATNGNLAGTSEVRARIFANASTTPASFALGGMAMIFVTSLLSDGEYAKLYRYMANYAGIEPIIPPDENYNPDEWESVAPTNIVTVWGQPFNNHSAMRPYSIQTAILEEIERYEIRPGDEWSGDVGRPQRYDRAELDSRTLNTPDENNDIFCYFQVNPFGVERGNRTSIAQLFADQVYLQLSTLPSGFVVTTFQGSGESLVGVDRYIDPPLRSGEPQHIVIRIRPNPSLGQVQVWRNGSSICNLSGIPIGNGSTSSVWKRGLYRQLGTTDLRMQVANFKTGAEAKSCLVLPPDFPDMWNGD